MSEQIDFIILIKSHETGSTNALMQLLSKRSFDHMKPKNPVLLRVYYESRFIKNHQKLLLQEHLSQQNVMLFQAIWIHKLEYARNTSQLSIRQVNTTPDSTPVKGYWRNIWPFDPRMSVIFLFYCDLTLLKAIFLSIWIARDSTEIIK